jgi:hypothetical protein
VGVHADERVTASAAWPEPRPKPNLESSWPVITYSWVWASTPGVTLTSRGWSVWPMASSRSISSKESTTMRRTLLVVADCSSAVDLLLPCATMRSGGTPALRATCSSPAVDTSTHIPSSCTSAAMALHRKAFDA